MFVIQTQEIFLGERSYLIGHLTVCLFDYGWLMTSCTFCKSLFLNRNDIKFELCITLLVCCFLCSFIRDAIRKIYWVNRIVYISGIGNATQHYMPKQSYLNKKDRASIIYYISNRFIPFGLLGCTWWTHNHSKKSGVDRVSSLSFYHYRPLCCTRLYSIGVCAHASLEDM